MAVVGSVMSSLYVAGLPADAPDSLGAAVQVGGAVADAAREAFVDAMSTASLLVAGVAAAGALIAWLHLPAQPSAQRGR